MKFGTNWRRYISCFAPLSNYILYQHRHPFEAVSCRMPSRIHVYSTRHDYSDVAHLVSEPQTILGMSGGDSSLAPVASGFTTRSGQNFLDDVAVDVCEAAVDAVLAVGQAFVVDAQKMQHRGVEVVAVRFPFLRLVSPVVALSVGDSRFDAGSGQPGDELAAVVIATVATLSERGAAELGRPDQQRVFEQAARSQVAN